jgi:amidase
LINDEFWRWDALDLARGIRTRALSSREAVESCLRRLDAVNPRLNAVVDVLADLGERLQPWREGPRSYR